MIQLTAAPPSSVQSRDATIELVNRYAGPEPVRELLYDGLPEAFWITTSRLYDITWRGTPSDLRRFVPRVLLDEVSESLHIDEPPANREYTYRVDVCLKPNILDLEKEAILDYQARADDTDFDLVDMTLFTRYYLSGKGSRGRVEDVLRHLVNPVIHQWTVHHD